MISVPLAVTLPERDELAIALRVRRDQQLIKNCTSRSEHRRGMSVLVRINADYDVEVFSQHEHRSFVGSTVNGADPSDAAAGL